MNYVYLERGDFSPPSDSDWYECEACKGKGYRMVGEPGDEIEDTCPDCEGAGGTDEDGNPCEKGGW